MITYNSGSQRFTVRVTDPFFYGAVRVKVKISQFETQSDGSIEFKYDWFQTFDLYINVNENHVISINEDLLLTGL